jgi:RND family efflux transporter MFP subunit
VRSRWIAAVSILAMAAVLAGCRPTNEFKPPPPPAVTVAQPLERPVVEYFQTTGETRAADMVEFRAQVSGYLKEIGFKDGEFVEEGRLLFRIDPHRYEAAVNSANANLLKANAALKLADAQLRRTETLVERKAATTEQLDVAKAEKASAEADVAAANSAISRAKLEVGFTEIKAPFAGRMGRHEVDVGNLVEVGTTRLAKLESVAPMHVYFTVNEDQLLRFLDSPEGELFASGSGSPEIELALGDGDDFTIKGGRLDFGEFGIDPATGTTLRRAVFDNPPPTLVPGLFARVRMAVGAAQPRLLVEERAISADQRGDFLLIVSEKKADEGAPEGQGKPNAGGTPGAPGANVGSPQPQGAPQEPATRHIVEYRPVKLGRADGGLRIIEQGLNAGEWVVINGLQRARPGTEVKPEQATMAEPVAGPPVAFRVLPAGATVAEAGETKAE